MSVDVASIAHVHNFDVEHAVANLFQVTSYLWLHLHELFPSSVGMTMTVNSETRLNISACLFAQEFVFDFVASSLLAEFGEVV